MGVPAHLGARGAGESLRTDGVERAASTAKSPVDFRTDPSRYRHWKLTIDGRVATLAMDVQVSGNRETDGGVLGERGAFVQDFAVIYVTGQPA